MDHDVIIVGGGPGGLSTALHLQQIAPHLSHRILILEKEHYPRFKLCAGGLTMDAEIILERLGLDVDEVPHALADDIHFDFEAKGLRIRIPKRHALRIIRRDEFDHWLARKAKSRGIEVREGITVRNIIPDKDGVIIETDNGTMRAQVVVGADGSNGITRRCVFPKDHVYTARVLEVLTPVTTALAPGASVATFGNQSSNTVGIAALPLEVHKDNRAYFEFSPIPGNIAGYVWDFPTQVKGAPMRCWGIYDTNLLANETRPHLKEPLAAEMKHFGFDLSKHEVKGYPIRWFSPENKMSAPRVLLVGDAVGADPALGEGISIALGYGALAAREIHESIQRGDFSFRGFKRRVVRSALGRTLIARWVIANIIYPIKWRWFQIFLWRFSKPFVVLIAQVFVLNWGKRLK